MKEIFEAIAEQLSLEFLYGRRDFVNLFEFNSSFPKKKMIVEINQSQSILDTETNSRRYVAHTGSFFIASESNLDEYYDKDDRGDGSEGKYELYLKPNGEVADSIQDLLRCNQKAFVEVWRSREAVNLFDMNADGVIVDFTIRVHE